MLMQAITTKFIPLGKDHMDSLFSSDGNGPICTFSAKIKLSHALGIISSETKIQIDAVRFIRNHFAHHKDKSSFDDASVRLECSKFKEIKGLRGLPEELRRLRTAGLTPKLRYVQVCIFVCSSLVGYINTIGTFR
jgi:DNA-binding MltR family transcriptional regulator